MIDEDTLKLLAAIESAKPPAASPTNGNGRWAKIGAFAAIAMFCLTVLGSLGGMMWWLFGLSSEQKNFTTNQASFEKRMDSLHVGLDRRITENSSNNQSVLLRVRAVERDLNEIETQFCANDQIRNTNLVYADRMIAMLWQKEFGQPYPVNNSYFPMICNRKADK